MMKFINYVKELLVLDKKEARVIWVLLILLVLWAYREMGIRERKFIEQSKITTGKIISFRYGGKRDKYLYASIEFLYKGNIIVGENRYSTNYMADEQDKWMHRKVLIAYDSLDPTTVSMILDEDQFKTYHLVMPDSLKNSNQLH